jgi:hypothetical protein
MIDIAELKTALEKGRVPFSFTVGGQTAELKFQHKRAKRRRPGMDYVYHVAGQPITVVVETNHVPEWDLFTWKFRLTARETLEGNVADVKIMDLSFDGAHTLHGWNGGCVYNTETHRNEAMDYFPPKEWRMWDVDLAEEGEFEHEDLLGRASVKYLPLWFLAGEQNGAWFGPEWSGTWRMGAECTDEGAAAHVQLPCLEFRLMQGEEAQMPPVSMGAYQGDVREGFVKLRRTIREEFMPTIEGERPDPPVICHAIGGSIPEWDAEGFEEEMKLCHSLGIEHLVFASAWYRPPTGSKTPFSLEELQELYPGTESVEDYEIVAFWEQCGLFEPYEDRFPGGIKACAEWMEEDLGIGLGVWYDPRVSTLCEPYERQRDAMVRNQAEEPNPACDLDLIDMGVESGRELMFELMERFVVEFGANFLWHDLCCHPRRGYWDGYEQEDRRGLKELRHYNGQDEVYDRFRREYPDVWIEWCGGGGTMLNLGLFRRAHTFHLADCCGIRDAQEPNSDHWRIYRTSLNWILPSTYLSNHFGPAGGMYEQHDRMGLEVWLTHMGSALNLHRTISRWSAEDRADAAEAIGVFKNYRKYLNKDFWSLFPNWEDHENWDGWQFHDPDTDTGILMFFKRRDCQEDDRTVELRWPDDLDGYTFGTVMGKATIEPQGGRTVRVTMPSKAALVRYDRGRGPAAERRG